MKTTTASESLFAALASIAAVPGRDLFPGGNYPYQLAGPQGGRATIPYKAHLAFDEGFPING